MIYWYCEEEYPTVYIKSSARNCLKLNEAEKKQLMLNVERFDGVLFFVTKFQRLS